MHDVIDLTGDDDAPLLPPPPPPLPSPQAPPVPGSPALVSRDYFLNISPFASPMRVLSPEASPPPPPRVIAEPRRKPAAAGRDEDRANRRRFEGYGRAVQRECDVLANQASPRNESLRRSQRTVAAEQRAVLELETTAAEALMEMHWGAPSGGKKGSRSAPADGGSPRRSGKFCKLNAVSS